LVAAGRAGFSHGQLISGCDGQKFRSRFNQGESRQIRIKSGLIKANQGKNNERRKQLRFLTTISRNLSGSDRPPVLRSLLSTVALAEADGEGGACPHIMSLICPIGLVAPKRVAAPGRPRPSRNAPFGAIGPKTC
jgi:hypothetical protein